MKTKLFLSTLFISLINFYGFSQSGKPTKVGEEIHKTFESNHPYNGSKTKNIELVSTQRIFEKNASYIAVGSKTADKDRSFNITDFNVILLTDSMRTSFFPY